MGVRKRHSLFSLFFCFFWGSWLRTFGCERTPGHCAVLKGLYHIVEPTGLAGPGLHLHEQTILLATHLARREAEFAQDSVAALGTVAGAAGAARGVSLYVRAPDGLQSTSGSVALRVGSSHLVGNEAGDMGIDLLGELHC